MEKESPLLKFCKDFVKTPQYYQLIYLQIAHNKNAFSYFADTCIMNGVDLETAKKILNDLVKGTYGTNRKVGDKK